MNIIMTQQFSGVAGIFTRDQADFFQGFYRPKSNIPQITDGVATTNKLIFYFLSFKVGQLT